jgi:hypothetical protein
MNIGVTAHHAAASFYLLPRRFWELLVGAALVNFARSKGRAASTLAPKCVGEASAAIAVGSLVVTAVVLDDHRAFPGWWTASPALAAFVLIALGDLSWINRTVLSSSVPVLVGLISYPLYLWHWPLLSLARIIEGPDVAVWLRAAAVALAIVAAWTTWRLVERPLQERILVFRGSRRLMSIWIQASIACVAALSLLGLATLQARGFPARLHVAQLSDLTPLRVLPDRFPRCEGLEGDDRLSWCNTAVHAVPQVAILGDSHALALFDGFAAEYGTRGQCPRDRAHRLCALATPPIGSSTLLPSGRRSRRPACSREA